MIYVYESHLGGGFFYTNDEIDYDDLYCDTCGESDQFVCCADSLDELKDMLMDTNFDKDYINEFIESVRSK